MMRKGLRKRVRLVQQGQDPPEMKPLSDQIVPTYGGDTLLKVDRAATPEDDKELTLRMGMGMANRYVQSPPNLPGTDQ